MMTGLLVVLILMLGGGVFMYLLARLVEGNKARKEKRKEEN